MKTGIELIADERNRQISEEGYTSGHDEYHHANFELGEAGACYAFAAVDIELTGRRADPHPGLWPWGAEDWKPTKDALGNLVKSGALIAAQIDRINRSL